MNIKCLKEVPVKDSRRCPAIIFAIKRTESVKGRMIRLIDSIITIKGMRGNGVPWGVRCEKNMLKKLKIL